MSIWQTRKWGEMLVKSKQVEGIFSIAGIQVEKRKVSFGEYGLFIQGFNYKGVFEKNSLKIEQALVDFCKRQKALFIQIEILNYDGKIEEKVFDLLYFSYGFYKNFIPPYTVIIDLLKSEEEILSSMKQKGRYNIKQAGKNNILCEVVKKTKKNIKLFYDLVKETKSRDNFSANSLEYYEIFLEIIDSSELIFAYKDSKLIAAGIFLFEKDVAIYYYGASTSDSKYRNLMAPYLLQWTAINQAKKRGCKIYDFLGIASPTDKKSTLKGVTEFKLKFNPEYKKVSEGYIWVNKPLKYFFIKFLRKIFRKK